MKQTITSAKTSRNQIPAALKKIEFEPDTKNLDMGGGKYEAATIYLKEKGVDNFVYDPYNRTNEHNAEVLEYINYQSFDTVTVLNVLNVIKEKEVRELVLKGALVGVKKGGRVYIQVYEGDKSGVGAETRDGWQNNMPLFKYQMEIENVFKYVYKKGNLIIASR